MGANRPPPLAPPPQQGPPPGSKSDYDYMTFRHPPVPQTYRKPPGNFKSYTVDLFSHPKVQDAFRLAKDHVINACYGPYENIDVFINEDLIEKDLLNGKGYNAFGLDCRNELANPLIAFILVMDMYGNIINVHNPPIRAESVVMFSTDTVLFSCIGGRGVYLWNWMTDEVHKMPFVADAHTVQFSYQQNRYFGLYLDDSAADMSRFDPTVAVSYDADTGRLGWQFEPEYSHINWLSVEGKYAYLSLRSYGCLQKVDMETNEVIWTLGGRASTVDIWDINDNYYSPQTKMRNSYKPHATESLFGAWQHQHHFDRLDDRFYGLFDNNVCPHGWCDETGSRMVLLLMDEANLAAAEVFSFDTGDQSRIYGTSILTPSGNVVGNSYHEYVYPSSEDRQYHVNLWEITPDNEIAWRVGIRGMNPWNPDDQQNEYCHAKTPGVEPPTGWLVYDVERFYTSPVVSQPCQTQNMYSGSTAIRFLPFNTIRTTDDLPGAAFLFDAGSQGAPISQTNFMFPRAWVPRPVEVDVPPNKMNSPLDLLIMNGWQEGTPVAVGMVNQLPYCEQIEAMGYRTFV
eukprot:CAMPEP_0113936022 /NCGR_PEP_ID=MMETSP1339-20121228/3017_1 /TAXON_ID=94617 /ORGANISM="Fibrocapsa japonica" /LENGTH=568 /DNA_ID=CAMNT_0000938351 /DNA_START=247 /DNA_END=1953 /DNA_ORIENTATION=+ /assembly_acc=CAM_ASM_000762